MLQRFPSEMGLCNHLGTCSGGWDLGASKACAEDVYEGGLKRRLRKALLVILFGGCGSTGGKEEVGIMVFLCSILLQTCVMSASRTDLVW